MSMRQRICLAALFLSALLMAACGAKQGKNVKITANWNALYDAVPADATYAIGLQLDDKNEVPMVLQGALSTLSDGGAASILSMLSQQELLDRSELVTFERKGTQWLITEVQDLSRTMEHLSDHYKNLGESYGEALTLEETRAGDRVHLSVADHTMGQDNSNYLEITGVGNYLVVRSAATDDPAAIAADMHRLSKGWDEVGRYSETEAGKNQRARAAGQPLQAWVFVNIAELNQELQNPEARGGINDLQQMVGLGEDASEECAAFNARLERLLPSFSLVKFKDAGGKNHVDGWLELSEAGVANGRVLMQGAPSLKGFAQEALLALGVSFDFGNFFDAMQATPAHAQCAGLAGVAGQLADFAGKYAAHIKFNARSVSGTGALVIEDVGLQGFIPTATVGAYIGSPNAEALFRRIVRAVNKHGSTDVVADASTPTVEGSFNGVPVKFRIEQGEDRVLIYSSALKGSIASRLLTVAPHADANVPFDLQVSAERLQKLQEDAQAYVEDMQMEDPRVDDLLDVLSERGHGVRVHVAFESGGLRIRIDQE